MSSCHREGGCIVVLMSSPASDDMISLRTQARARVVGTRRWGWGQQRHHRRRRVVVVASSRLPEVSEDEEEGGDGG